MTEWHGDVIIGFLALSCSIQMARYAEDSKKLSDRVIALLLALACVAFFLAAFR